jgi:exodeoxyribonuclease VII small subunit
MTQKDREQPSDDNRALAEFEQSLAELETLVENLESGDLSLEASLEKFERGVALARACQDALKTAELRVRQLVEKDGDDEIADFGDDGHE